MKKFVFFFTFFLVSIQARVQAQVQQDSLLQDASLDACVQYALKNYPLIRQNKIDQEITESQIKGKIADWYPQVNLAGTYQNTFQKQTFVTSAGKNAVGTYNTSAVQLGATQNIFNRDALLASRSANDVRQNTTNQLISNKIDLAANVMKSYYAVLTLLQQMSVLDGDIIRLERSLKDSYNQYKAGVVDNTDYKQATINLNNAIAQRKGFSALLPAYYTTLKTYLNYPQDQNITVHYDSVKLENEALIDTAGYFDVQNRIEYKSLVTNKRLLEANLKYEKWSYLPTISLFANYNMNYLNDRFSHLYRDNFPQSYAGLQVTMPIFQGGKRKQNIHVAELNLQRNAWDFANLNNAVNREYVAALSTYKSDLANFNATKDNLQLAQEVYNTVNLQYRSGVKRYLDVITAETTLRTARINYTNALFQLLTDKVDVEKAQGTIQIN